MASESEQGHVDCTVKRRTRLVRITFVGSSVQSLTNSNRRIRNRTYGGVGGADERLSPLSRSALSRCGIGLSPGCSAHLAVKRSPFNHSGNCSAPTFRRVL